MHTKFWSERDHLEDLGIDREDDIRI